MTAIMHKDLKVQYLLPNHPKSDPRLRTICKRAHPITSFLHLTSDLYSNHEKITYGYLGTFARTIKAGPSSIQKIALQRLAILDHAYAPKSHKFGLFRASRFSTQLHTLELADQDLLENKHKNDLYSYLKEQQEEAQITLTGRTIKDFSAKSISNILLINPAPVLLALRSINRESFNQELINRIQDRHGSKNIYNSYKPIEIDLTKTGERDKQKRQCEEKLFQYDAIEKVYCPTSMLALHFILKGIPVELSNLHPLQKILGENIHTHSKQEALDIVYNSLLKTTFSIRRIRKFERFIASASR